MTEFVTLDRAARARGDDFVSAWLGVPFAWDGRSRDGVDCWGLLMLFHAEVFRLALPDWRRGDHGRAWIAATIAEQAKSHWRGLERPHDGAIVMALAGASPSLPGDPRAAPRHVGIYWRGGVLHATDTRGVILERLAEFGACYPRHEFGDYVA